MPSGRSALLLMPEGQVNSLSRQAFEDFKSENRLITSGPQYRMVQNVGSRIATVAGPSLPSAEWEFVLVDDERINAFAMPGGNIAVFMGLFDVVETPDELAIVIGHEAAHITLQHGRERISQQMLITGLTIGAFTGTRDMEPRNRELLLAAFGAGSALGIMLPYSRQQEYEADHFGLLYAARAGFDPRVAIPFWERMEAQSRGGRPPEFLSTHPSYGNRVARLRDSMPQAIQEFERAQAIGITGD